MVHSDIGNIDTNNGLRGSTELLQGPATLSGAVFNCFRDL
jgi:hypothetical protein